VLSGIDLLNAVKVSHNYSTLRLCVMDSVFLYGTDTAGISVYESNFAQPVYTLFCVVIVNLLATIPLEVTADVALEVVAVVN
jgi:hypothetical protein